jgi:hypothetical protein
MSSNTVPKPGCVAKNWGCLPLVAGTILLIASLLGANIPWWIIAVLFCLGFVGAVRGGMMIQEEAKQEQNTLFSRLKGIELGPAQNRRLSGNPTETDQRSRALEAARNFWVEHGDEHRDFICDSCNGDIPKEGREGTSLYGGWMRCRSCTDRLFSTGL